jgi:hypothetical protein
MKRILLLILLIYTAHSQAQDRLFTYTYQSTVLNKGQKEIEVWTTFQNGRENYYRGLQNRLEFEIGLGSRLQTAFYLNSAYSKGIVENEGTESVETSTKFSFSNEWKFKITDPVADLLGTGLYFEYTVSPSDIELEGKLIFDKQIGKTVQALNIVGEAEFGSEFEPDGDEIEVETETEMALNLNYAFAWKAARGLAVGLEARNQNGFSDDGVAYSVLSAGPCLSYSFSGFWINLTVMPQITDFTTGSRDLSGNEKLQARLIFSYVF